MEHKVLNTYDVTLNNGSAVIYRRYRNYLTHAYKSCVTYRLLALFDDNREYDLIGNSVESVLETLKDITHCEIIGVVKVK